MMKGFWDLTVWNLFLGAWSFIDGGPSSLSSSGWPVELNQRSRFTFQIDNTELTIDNQKRDSRMWSPFFAAPLLAGRCSTEFCI